MYSWMDGWPNDRNNPLVLVEAECLFCRILELIKTWAILSAFRLFEYLWYLLHAGELSLGAHRVCELRWWFYGVISFILIPHWICHSVNAFTRVQAWKDMESECLWFRWWMMLRSNLVFIQHFIEWEAASCLLYNYRDNMQGILYNCASFSHAIQLGVYKVGEDSHEHKSSIYMMGTQKCLVKIFSDSNIQPCTL